MKVKYTAASIDNGKRQEFMEGINILYLQYSIICKYALRTLTRIIVLLIVYNNVTLTKLQIVLSP